MIPFLRKKLAALILFSLSSSAYHAKAMKKRNALKPERKGILLPWNMQSI